MNTRFFLWCPVALLVFLTGSVSSKNPIDTEYTNEVKEYTTDERFLTDWVMPVPVSETVPSPKQVLGYVPGTPGRLTDVAGIHAYFRALDEASPRVSVSVMGASEEGREILLAVIADEDTLRHIDRYRDITRSLADPRNLDETQAEALIASGKPIYWLTGALHSPETGSPEMLMELAYRLAVSDDPRIEHIRNHVIVLITPVQEVDGRDRFVDLVRYRSNHPDKPFPRLVYWGHYVAHDNNRDYLGLALNLTRSMLQTFFLWHPQVQHDLHESIPFLYISSGTGPYNAWLDPSVITEWQEMAWYEVGELTRYGVPGVWTHGFWDGWAPNYMFYIALGHNALGRFYETFGNAVPDTMERHIREEASRAWYRLNPPLHKVQWSLRNNINIMQSGVLSALYYTSLHAKDFLRNFYIRSRKALQKPWEEGPAAWVLPADETRRDLQSRLVSLLRQHGIEVKRLLSPWKIEERTIPKGSYIIRMDQPYSRLADMLLDKQYYSPKDPRPYDDTGWTLGAMFNIKTERITSLSILDVPTENLTQTSELPLFEGSGPYLIIPHRAEPADFLLPYRLKNASLEYSVSEFKIGKRSFPPGTWVLHEKQDNAADIIAFLKESGRSAFRTSKLPDVHREPVKIPRIALVHSWMNTQQEGWYRYAMDSLGIPYSYFSIQQIPTMEDLRARFDVLILGPGIGSPQDLVQGIPADSAIPWQTAPETPSLGRIDSTEDMRPGMGLAGVLKIQNFVENGGVLVTIGSSSRFPIDFGIVRWVQAHDPERLRVSGTLLQSLVNDPRSPITYGYDKNLPVYYDGDLIFQVGFRLPFEMDYENPESIRPSGRGSPSEPDWIIGRPPESHEKPSKPSFWDKGFKFLDPVYELWFGHFVPPLEKRPRVVLRFADKKEDMLVSGLLENSEELAGTPAVIDVPVGRGHVVLYAINPVWRNQSWGTYALFFNTLLYGDRLGTGWPPLEALQMEANKDLNRES